MYKNLLEIQKRTEQIVKENKSDTDWREEISYFQLELSHLNQERLIHLIVTLTVGVVGIASVFVTIFRPSLPLFVLDIIFMGLFAAYIFHYKRLEDTAQYWYEIIHRLKDKL